MTQAERDLEIAARLRQAGQVPRIEWDIDNFGWISVRCRGLTDAQVEKLRDRLVAGFEAQARASLQTGALTSSRSSDPRLQTSDRDGGLNRVRMTRRCIESALELLNDPHTNAGTKAGTS